MGATCHSCGGEYERVSQHYAMSSCDYPTFSDHQHDILTGLLMGDGSCPIEQNRNPRMVCAMISKEYLEYLSSKFPHTSGIVRLEQTAAEEAQRNRDRGGNRAFSNDPEDYSDLYRLNWKGNPNFEQYSKWYQTGKKVWPENIDLNPTVLKHWYVGDGSLETDGNYRSISISLSNEAQNKQKVNAYFTDKGLPEPSWKVHQRTNLGRKRACIQFTRDKTDELLDYMGEPLPGFSYKWPEDLTADE